MCRCKSNMKQSSSRCKDSTTGPYVEQVDLKKVINSIKSKEMMNAFDICVPVFSEYDEDILILESLVDDKIEINTRSEFLKNGTQWYSCFEMVLFGEFAKIRIEEGAPIELIDVVDCQEGFEVIFRIEKLDDVARVPYQQFINSFRPLRRKHEKKEGNCDITKNLNIVNSLQI